MNGETLLIRPCLPLSFGETIGLETREEAATIPFFFAKQTLRIPREIAQKISYLGYSSVGKLLEIGKGDTIK